MNRPIRVLIADDSLAVRCLLVDILNQAAGFELVGQAKNGEEAVALCQALKPDVVALDLMMPEMDGLRATELIMAHNPTPILIVASLSEPNTDRGKSEALAAGAVDVLDKGFGEEWQARFLRALRLVSKVRVITHPRGRLPGLSARSKAPTWSPPLPPLASEATIRVVALGGSTGGPGAVSAILKDLPADLRVPILLVLHTSESFGEGLAAWLNSQSPLSVRHAIDSEPLSEVSGVVMAPPGKHLILSHGRLRLTLEPERNSCRPSVDVLFESLAEQVGSHTCACLLTGMGKDGAKGLLALRKAGAVTIAQDEMSSIVYGMPREAILLGAVDRCAPLGQIARLIAESVQRKQSPA